MNDQKLNISKSEKAATESKAVNIQPSEPNADSPDQSEENAAGRTPGKAEGSREIIEEDLAEKDGE